jgi:serine/threonine protein kinase
MARYLFKQMVDTLIYINSMGISHRDIKLENLLITNNYELKFADFGFASYSKEVLT